MGTEDRETRHFKRAAPQRRCRCGAICTVLHVSWECRFYANERQHAIRVLPNHAAAPNCFRYALLPTTNYRKES